MNPIETTFSSGAILYAVLHHTDGRVWNNVALEFGKEYADKPKYYPAWVWRLCKK